jgi:O-antigen/teichoic acid export membrane protein
MSDAGGTQAPAAPRGDEAALAANTEPHPGGVREALKKLTGESVIYGIGQVSGRAVQLLLVPVLTRALTRGEYGVSELVQAYLQTALLVLVLGMDAALARFFYQEPDRAARQRMVSTSLAFRIVAGVSVALVLAACARPLAAGLVGSGDYHKYVRIGAAILPFTLLVLFCNDVLRVTFQPWKFIALNVVNTTLVAGIALALVLGRHLGVVGVLYGKLAGDLLTALVGLVLIRHTLRPALRADVLKRMLRYGLPLVPVAIAYGAIASVDRYVLQHTRSIEEVAVYSLAVKFFAIVTMGVSAFQLAYFPFAYARAGSPEAPRLYARVLGLYVAAAALGAMAIGLFAPDAVRLLAPPAYAGAARPAAWLAFAAVAQGAYYVVSLGIGLALRTPLFGWSAGGAALVAVIANLVLTPRFGPVGAGAATSLGYIASALLAYGIAQRVHPLPYRGGRALAMFAVALVVTLAAQPLAGAAGVAVKLALLLAAAGAAAWLEWRGSRAPRRA